MSNNLKETAGDDNANPALFNSKLKEIVGELKAIKNELSAHREAYPQRGTTGSAAAESIDKNLIAESLDEVADLAQTLNEIVLTQTAGEPMALHNEGEFDEEAANLDQLVTDLETTEEPAGEIYASFAEVGLNLDEEATELLPLNEALGLVELSDNLEAEEAPGPVFNLEEEPLNMPVNDEELLTSKEDSVELEDYGSFSLVDMKLFENENSLSELDLSPLAMAKIERFADVEINIPEDSYAADALPIEPSALLPEQEEMAESLPTLEINEEADLSLPTDEIEINEEELPLPLEVTEVTEEIMPLEIAELSEEELDLSLPANELEVTEEEITLPLPTDEEILEVAELTEEELALPLLADELTEEPVAEEIDGLSSDINEELAEFIPNNDEYAKISEFNGLPDLDELEQALALPVEDMADEEELDSGPVAPAEAELATGDDVVSDNILLEGNIAFEDDLSEAVSAAETELLVGSGDIELPASEVEEITTEEVTLAPLEEEFKVAEVETEPVLAAEELSEEEVLAEDPLTAEYLRLAQEGEAEKLAKEAAEEKLAAEYLQLAQEAEAERALEEEVTEEKTVTTEDDPLAAEYLRLAQEGEAEKLAKEAAEEKLAAEYLQLAQEGESERALEEEVTEEVIPEDTLPVAESNEEPAETEELNFSEVDNLEAEPAMELAAEALEEEAIDISRLLAKAGENMVSPNLDMPEPVAGEIELTEEINEEITSTEPYFEENETEPVLAAEEKNEEIIPTEDPLAAEYLRLAQEGEAEKLAKEAAEEKLAAEYLQLAQEAEAERTLEEEVTEEKTVTTEDDPLAAEYLRLAQEGEAEKVAAEAAEETEEVVVDISQLLAKAGENMVSPNLDMPEPVAAEEKAEETAATVTEPQPKEESRPFVAPSNGELSEDMAKLLAYLDDFLADLPEEKLQSFVHSGYFGLYERLMRELGVK